MQPGALVKYTLPTNTVKALFFFFSSRKLALLLLCFFVLSIFLGEIAPPKIRKQIYSSVWFLGLLIILFLNLFFCTSEKVSFLLKIRKIKLSLWASPLFHSGLLLIFFGGIISGLTHFSGIIELTEGQILSETRKDYFQILREPFLPRKDKNFQIELLKFIPTYYPNGEAKDFRSFLLLHRSGNKKKKEVYVSKPLSYSGVLIYQHERNGLSALVNFYSFRGELDDRRYVLFDKPKKLGGPFTGHYSIENTPFSIEGELFPDYGKESFLIGEPSLKIKIFWGKDLVYQTDLRLGERKKFFYYTYSFEEIKYWSAYNLVEDKGKNIIFAGFFITFFGMGLLVFERFRRNLP